MKPLLRLFRAGIQSIKYRYVVHTLYLTTKNAFLFIPDARRKPACCARGSEDAWL